MKRTLLALLLGLLLALSLTACGSRESAQSVTESTIQALQAMDTESLQEYWGPSLGSDDLNVEDEQVIQMLRLMTQNLTYEVLAAQEAADTAVVTVEFTNIDMAPVLAASLTSALEEVLPYAFLPEDQQLSDEEISAIYLEKLTEALSQEDLDTTTAKVDVNLVLTDGQWEVTPDDELVDAMLGGFLSAADTLGEDLAS